MEPQRQKPTPSLQRLDFGGVTSGLRFLASLRQGLRKLVRSPSDAVALCLASVLLVAAGLKGYDLASHPSAGTGPFSSYPSQVALVEFEFLFGLWLAAGFCPRGTWVASVIWFGGLACTALFNALAGEESCGCLGSVSPSPWWMFAFDVSLLAALLRWRPTGLPSHTRGRFAGAQMVPFGAASILIMLPTGLVLSAGSSRRVDPRKQTAATESNPAQAQRDGRLFPDYVAARREKLRDAVACGPLALIEVLESVGVQLDEGAKRDILAAAGSRGTDLLKLQELAHRYGVHSVGVALSPDDLKRLSLPAVVHMNSSTFMAITEYRRRGFDVITPAGSTATYSDDRFRDSFGSVGRALLVSKTPLSEASLGLAASTARKHEAPRGPVLRFEATALGVGRIRGPSWTGQLAFHNDGNDVLRIRRLSSSSTRMKARVSKAVLSPGEVGILRVEGEERQSGKFARTVTLATNELARSRVRIPVRGYLELNSLLERPGVLLVAVQSGSCTCTPIPLDLPEHLNAASLVIDPVDKRLVAAIDAPDIAGRAFLKLAWQGPAGPGWYRYRLVIRSRPGSAEVSAMNVTVNVLPDIEAAPASLLISKQESGGRWLRTVRLRPHQDCQGAASFDWSDAAFRDAVAVTIKRASDGGRTLIMAPRKPGALRALAGQRASVRVSIGKCGCTVSMLVKGERLRDLRRGAVD